jgi:hypothetical protein
MDDATLGGYEKVHARPPTFGGLDGFSYTASVFVDDEPDAGGRFGAALLFLRWAPGGERPIGHVESDYLAHAATPAEATAAVAALSLHDVKAHLDRCVARGTP